MEYAYLLFWAIPLWLLVFYDIWTSKNSGNTKAVLLAINLVFFAIGSLVYLCFVLFSREPSFLRKQLLAISDDVKKSLKKIVPVFLLELCMVVLLLAVA